jgi:hypothetical protein
VGDRKFAGRKAGALKDSIYGFGKAISFFSRCFPVLVGSEADGMPRKRFLPALGVVDVAVKGLIQLL